MARGASGISDDKEGGVTRNPITPHYLRKLYVFPLVKCFVSAFHKGEMKTSTSKLIRWCGLAAIVSGVLAAISSFVKYEPDSPLIWLTLAQALATIFALVGIYAVQHVESGVWGFTGLFLAIAGNVLDTYGSTIAGVKVYVIGLSLYGLGLILLAVGTVIGRKLPRWIPALWILAPLFGIPGAWFPAYAPILYIIAGVTFGLGFVGAGYVLWTGRVAASA